MDGAITAKASGVKRVAIELLPADKMRVGSIAYAGGNHAQHKNKRNYINQSTTADLRFPTHNGPPLENQKLNIKNQNCGVAVPASAGSKNGGGAQIREFLTVMVGG